MFIPEPKLPKNDPPLLQKMRFNFSHVRPKGKFSCRALNLDQASMIIKKLKEYKRMTGQQFRQTHGVGLKTVKKKDFPKPPPNLSPEILDALGYEFRTSKKSRIMGYLHQSIFYIMIIDPDHRYL